MKDKTNTYEIILAGSGGQGLVSSGIMLGEAAILEGKQVMQATSYGIAQRGGLASAEVMISSKEILFQHVQKPNLILALTEESLNLYLPQASSGAAIFYDTTLIQTTFVQKHEKNNLYGYPFTEIANELGHSGVANIIALGVMIGKSKMIKYASMEMVLRKHFSGKTAEMNVKALYQGRRLGEGQI